MSHLPLHLPPHTASASQEGPHCHHCCGPSCACLPLHCHCPASSAHCTIRPATSLSLGCLLPACTYSAPRHACPQEGLHCTPPLLHCCLHLPLCTSAVEEELPLCTSSHCLHRATAYCWPHTWEEEVHLFSHCLPRHRKNLY